MEANTELLERLEGSENSVPPRAEPASKSAIRHREEAELLEFALREATSEWFYDLELNGAEIEGIGIGGAMELARFRAEQGYPIRILNGIELLEVSRNGSLGVQATVVARESKTSREGVGVAFFPYWMEIPGSDPAAERKVVEDTRADRKALSIAKRNGILDLIPDEVIRQILAARKQIVPANEARKEAEAALVRRMSTAPIRRMTPEQLRAEETGPYDTKLPPKTTPVTVPQIVQLCHLIASPVVAENVRDLVKAKLETGLSESQAANWISLLEAEVKTAE